MYCFTMPIYAYKCDACGHAKDVLQKISDPLLTVCPSCGQASFKKQVTAAGFQLKGSGWYVTDFRDGKKTGAEKKPEADKAAEGKDAAAPAQPSNADAGSNSGNNDKGDKAASAPSPAAAPASAPASTPASTPTPGPAAA
jgi:putative FmdB family regulatory protein